MFKECHTCDESGNSYGLSLVSCKCIGAYVRNKKNQNQVYLEKFPGHFAWHMGFEYQSIYMCVCVCVCVKLHNWCRFAGYGKKFVHRRTEGFRSSWTMFSTSVLASYVMNVCLDQVMSAPEGLVIP